MLSAPLPLKFISGNTTAFLKNHKIF